MKTSMLKILAAASLLLVGCSSSTTTDSTDLRSVLDDSADREGVPAGECRDKCVAAALAVFDACSEQSDDREQCFGEAIHAFFECVRECKEPPTCEEGCKAAAAIVLEECLDGLEPGGDEAACAELAREAFAECLAEECGEPEPPSCEGKCGVIAKHVYDACTRKIDFEERCEKIARVIERLCNKHCEGYECPCHGDHDCDDEDRDKECNGRGNGHFKDRGNGHGEGKHCYD